MASEHSTEIARRAAEILSQLTIEEKVSLLSGKTTWRTIAMPAHDVLGIKLTDGPNGARGESIYNSTKAVCFPCGACLGATWDVDLVTKVGVEIGREVKTKKAQVLLGPTMNIHRSPLHGRNFESFSEDPTLTGLLAAAYINGVQSEGIAACPKHFIANEVEKNRTSVDTLVTVSTLREIYLKAFQIMFKNSDPLCLMTSYNKVNSEWCSQDPWLLQNVLRQEWKFKGLIVSDWFGTYSDVKPIKAGMNLEMPGPTKHRGEKTVSAFSNGLLSEEEIDYCALPVLELALKLGKYVTEGKELCDITAERIAITRKAATEAIVLLKNDRKVLPILREQLKKIAVIGTYANEPVPHGGGSASVRSSKVISPLQALQSALPDVTITTSSGVPTFKKGPCPPLKSTYLQPNFSSANGVQIEWFDERLFTGGKLLANDTLDAFNVVLIDPQIPGLKPDHCVRLTTYFQPEKSSVYGFALTSSGPSTLYIDDKEFNTYDGMNKVNEDFIWQPSKYEKRKTLHLEAGRFYKVVLEAQGTYAMVPPGMTICPQGCRVGIFPSRTAESAIEEAVSIATDSDLAIIFVGNSIECESEGFDRDTISLSAGQDDLVSAIASKQKNAIVVNQSGAPVAFPWVDEVSAILQVFFAGQEVGNAIADILLGTANPSGKLPTTFPARIEDSASYGNFPGSDIAEGNSIAYKEGQLVGYRHFEAYEDLQPMFPFGHGLSYTTFQINRFEIEDVDDNGNDPIVRLRAQITNAGPILGSEVLQVYVSVPHEAEKSGTGVDIKVLKAFKKVHDIEPGDTRLVSFKLDKMAFSTWDESVGRWKVRKGQHRVFLQSSSAVELGVVDVKLQAGYEWLGL